MEFKLVGCCCYHRGYPASHSASPLLPFLMGHQNYSQSQAVNQVKILVQILISLSFPPIGCMLDRQLLIVAQRLGLEGVLGDSKGETDSFGCEIKQ